MNVQTAVKQMKETRRDALVDYYIAYCIPDTPIDEGVPLSTRIRTANDLYEYLLIDTRISEVFRRSIGKIAGDPMGWPHGFAGQALSLLHAACIPVCVDLFLDDAIRGLAGNEASLAAFPGLVQTRPFSGKAELRKLVWDLPAGQAALLFIDNYHVISVAKCSDGYRVFDTALNPSKNVYEGARSFAGMTTHGGANHVQGSEAEALIERYLDEIRSQPALFRFAQTFLDCVDA